MDTPLRTVRTNIVQSIRAFTVNELAIGRTTFEPAFFVC